MELEGVSTLVDELDKVVPKDNARVGLYQYGGEGDGSFMVATRNGYLRFGIELLKAGLVPLESGTAKTAVAPDMRYLMDENSTIDLTTFELVEEYEEELPEESWGDTVFIYTILAILIAIPILALFGLITLIRMLF